MYCICIHACSFFFNGKDLCLLSPCQATSISISFLLFPACTTICIQYKFIYIIVIFCIYRTGAIGLLGKPNTQEKKIG